MAKLAQYPDEVCEQSNKTSEATDEKEAPEALEVEPVRINLRVVQAASTLFQPLVMDPLEITIL